jgi:hypothetical protein
MPAPPAMRARCLAAFDLDPSKRNMAFGARTHLRLRVTRRSISSSISSTAYSHSDPEDIGDLMSLVQKEAFDEDLFNQVSMTFNRADSDPHGSGASRRQHHRAAISHHQRGGRRLDHKTCETGLELV